MAGYIGKQAVVLSTTAADVNGNADIDGNVTATGDFITDEGKVKAERVEVENDTGPNMYATAYGTGSTTYTWFEGTGDNKLISWGNNGDISFYDDDGSTVKFRWDASNETLGVGSSDTAPSGATTDLYIDSSVPMVELQDSDDSTYSRMYHSAGSFLIDVDRGNTGASSYFQVKIDDSSSKVFKMDSSGNVGIGTDSPSSNYGSTLHVHNTGTGSTIHLTDGTSGSGANDGTDFLHYGADTYITNRESTGVTRFYNGGSERMRIDSSGNVDVYQGNDLTWRYAAGSTIRGSMSVDSADNMTFRTGSGNTERMRIDTSGRVGIGTSSPSETLEVSGKAKATEFVANGVAGVSVNNHYAHMGSTVSGAMAIFGHNINTDSSDANKVLSANTGYHSAMMKMYYNQGITFHTMPTTATAGSTFYDINGTTNEVMRIDNNGRVTMPYQPAFRVNGTNQVTCTSSATFYTWSNWSTTASGAFNQGGHFNTSNGRFVAPVAGVYMFYGSYLRNNNSLVFRGHFTVNGSKLAQHKRSPEAWSGYNDSSTLCAIIKLQANDYVQWGVTCDTSGGQLYNEGSSGNYNYFGGYLIG